MTLASEIAVGQALPERQHTPDNVQLFFYNAVLWNAHRIHYDLPYATDVEGYPGLVIAGSIVGSGELIATTATGAEAGFWLLWLIIVGCVIKVFVQVEFNQQTYTGKAASVDIIDASARAYLNAVNKALYEVQRKNPKKTPVATKIT